MISGNSFLIGIDSSIFLFIVSIAHGKGSPAEVTMTLHFLFAFGSLLTRSMTVRIMRDAVGINSSDTGMLIPNLASG